MNSCNGLNFREHYTPLWGWIATDRLILLSRQCGLDRLELKTIKNGNELLIIIENEKIKFYGRRMDSKYNYLLWDEELINFDGESVMLIDEIILLYQNNKDFSHIFEGKINL